MIPALLGILAVYAGTNAYMALRLCKWLGRGRILFLSAYAVLASLFIVTELLPGLPDPIWKPLNRIGGYFLQSYIFLLVLVPLCHLALRERGGPVTAAVILLAVTALTVFGALSAAKINIKSYTVETSLEEDVKIALISDMHIGRIIGEKQTARMIKAINSIEPDYVFIAGDIFDSGVPDVRDGYAIGRLFSQIKSKNGVYACLGNHDGGFRGLESQAAELLESWGVTVLQDECVTAGNINITGRRDRINSRLTAAELPFGDGRYNIILDHQPYDFDAEKAAGADLILCGHTHRGQIFPGNLVTRAMYRLDYGMMTEDGCTMIVSSGAGTWGPRIRLGSRSEVVSITLTAAE